MKVLLVKPNKKKRYFIVPPIGLGYLATSLREEKHEVQILDCLRNKMVLKEVKNYFEKYNPDVIGFQTFPDDLKTVKKYVELAKGVNPRVITISGGPFPSCLPEEILELLDNIDYAFQGEAEKGLCMLLNCIESGKSNQLESVPGLVWRKSGRTRINPQHFERDLDNLGIPAWDLIPPDKYNETYHGAFAKKPPVALVQTKRGCPFRCKFCAGNRINGRVVRKRSVNKVMEEIDLLYRMYGIGEVHIEDDNFTINKKDVIDFCKALIEKKYKLLFSCPNGVSLKTLDSEILGWMKRAGFYALHVGVESGSEKILKSMKKELTKREIKEKISLIKKFGIKVVGLFVLGYPGETKESIKETIEFSKELDLDRAQFGIFLPLPGTDIFKELVNNGQLEDIDWDLYYSYGHVVHEPKHMTKQELKKIQRRAFLEFYLRPKIFSKLLRDILSIKHFKFLIMRVNDFL